MYEEPISSSYAFTYKMRIKGKFQSKIIKTLSERYLNKENKEYLKNVWKVQFKYTFTGT